MVGLIMWWWGLGRLWMDAWHGKFKPLFQFPNDRSPAWNIVLMTFRRPAHICLLECSFLTHSGCVMLSLPPGCVLGVWCLLSSEGKGRQGKWRKGTETRTRKKDKQTCTRLQAYPWLSTRSTSYKPLISMCMLLKGCLFFSSSSLIAILQSHFYETSALTF